MNSRPRRDNGRVIAGTVTEVRVLSAGMRRITIAAEEFTDYEPTGPDEYLGLILPADIDAALVLPESSVNIRAAVAALPESQRPSLRWYTLRAHRPEAGEIDVDMVVHGDSGPGSRFATHARAGTLVGVRECASLYVPEAAPGSRLLVGDETALPAIARILETSRGESDLVYIEVPNLEEQRDSEFEGEVNWVLRERGNPGAALARAVAMADLPASLDVVWVCGERSGVQQIRRHLVTQRGVPKERIVFSGYWLRGEARL